MSKFYIAAFNDNNVTAIYEASTLFFSVAIFMYREAASSWDIRASFLKFHCQNLVDKSGFKWYGDFVVLVDVKYKVASFPSATKICGGKPKIHPHSVHMNSSLSISFACFCNKK